MLRQWEVRPTTVIDLIKAKREAEFPDIRRPACEIWIEPTLEDIERFINDYITSDVESFLSTLRRLDHELLALGSPPTANLAIVIPFDDERTKTGSYWPDSRD